MKVCRCEMVSSHQMPKWNIGNFDKNIYGYTSGEEKVALHPGNSLFCPF